MRTNIVLNDDLVQVAMHYTTGSSKRALIEEALKTFVEVKAAERQRTTYRERLRQLEGSHPGDRSGVSGDGVRSGLHRARALPRGAPGDR